MSWKHARQEIAISSLNAQKAFKIGSQNQLKTKENPVPNHLVSILLLPWSSKVLSRCQIGPPRCNMEAQSLPNSDREKLKGAGGRRRSPSDKEMLPEASDKHHKSSPESLKFQLLEKLGFATRLMLCLGTPGVRFGFKKSVSKMTWEEHDTTASPCLWGASRLRV